MTSDEHQTRLARLAEAFEREIIATTDEEIVAEIGLDEIRRARSLLAAVKARVARKLLTDARAEYEAWRSEQGKRPSSNRTATHQEFESLKRKDPGFDKKMMLAARNGRAPTKRDEEGLVDDFEDLKRLEDEGKSE
jgi:hypothetical protein